jgi:hypothetical protein
MAAQMLQNEDCVMAPLLGWFLFMHDVVNPCRSSSTRSDHRPAMQCKAAGVIWPDRASFVFLIRCCSRPNTVSNVFLIFDT